PSSGMSGNNSSTSTRSFSFTSGCTRVNLPHPRFPIRSRLLIQGWRRMTMDDISCESAAVETPAQVAAGRPRRRRVLVLVLAPVLVSGAALGVLLEARGGD